MKQASKDLKKLLFAYCLECSLLRLENRLLSKSFAISKYTDELA